MKTNFILSPRIQLIIQDNFMFLLKDRFNLNLPSKIYVPLYTKESIFLSFIEPKNLSFLQ